MDDATVFFIVPGMITGKYAGNRQFRVDVKFEYNGKDYTIDN